MKERPSQESPLLNEALTEYCRSDTLGEESWVRQTENLPDGLADVVGDVETVARFRLQLVREADVPYDRRVVCDQPESAARFLHQVMEGLDREVVGAIYVNFQHSVIGHTFAYVGTLGSALAEPRGIFVPALLANAGAVILFHNHPSGTVEPSSDDVNLTERMKKAGEHLGITVLDHIIIGEAPNFLSFRQRRLL